MRPSSSLPPYMYYALCFVHVEHSGCHERISVLINIFMLLAWCLLITLLVLTLTMRQLRHWPSIAGMLPQSHWDDVEDGRIGLSSWRHYVYIYICIYTYIPFLTKLKVGRWSFLKEAAVSCVKLVECFSLSVWWSSVAIRLDIVIRNILLSSCRNSFVALFWI